MRYRASKIKTGNWVQLGNMPMHNGKPRDLYISDQIKYYEDLLKIPFGSQSVLQNRRTIYDRVRYVSTHSIKRSIKNLKKPGWVKVVGTRDGLKYRGFYNYPTTFYAKWITNVAKTKADIQKV